MEHEDTCTVLVHFCKQYHIMSVLGHTPSEPHPLQEAIGAELVNSTNKSRSTNTTIGEDYLMEATVRLSYGQMEDSSDSEDFHTPPSSPSSDQVMIRLE